MIGSFECLRIVIGSFECLRIVIGSIVQVSFWSNNTGNHSKLAKRENSVERQNASRGNNDYFK